ncbi:MAG: dephospho-CoA kinase [Pontibacterium sp.]
MSKPFKVGLTGGIGSGKSAVSDHLASLGITIVDSDVIAREVVQKGEQALNLIAQHFGDHVLTSEGELDRAVLRELIFDQPEERKWLESLLHPIIRKRTIQALDSATSPYVVLASPLLIEAKQTVLVDFVVVVDVPEATQLSRTLARDGVSEAQIKAILAAQCTRQERLQAADLVVSNAGTLDELYTQVSKLHTELLKH